jgi:Tfp pilus assembly protein PilV
MELMKRVRITNNIHGVSLIEAMIALFLITFGLLALATTLVPPMRLNEKSKNMTQALFLADATLEMITKDRGVVELGTDIAQINSPTINASDIFTRTITHAAVGAAIYPRQVTVQISWPGADGTQRRISVASIVR